MFACFLACGGDVGKMQCVEELTRSETDSAIRSKEWKTKKEIEERFGVEAAADLVSRIRKDPARKADIKV